MDFMFLMEIEGERIRRRRFLKRKILFTKAKQRRSQAITKCYSESIRAIASVGLSYKNRSIWMKARSDAWWDDVVLNLMHFSDADWISNFRMDRQTFLEVCNLVHEDLKPKPSFLQSREPICTEKRVEIALYKLASCGEMRLVANSMGVSITTVHRSLRKFVLAMLKHVSDFIKMPTKEEAIEISAKFEEISKIPQILCVIDGTHIPITAPRVGYGDFKNRKGWCSYNTQVVADVNYIFRDISCQYPGASHDACVFKNSGLFLYADNCMPKNPKTINAEVVDFFIIGDPAYPLLSWLIKGFSGTHLSAEEESFNAYLNSSRIIIEQSIGKLKSRWRILKKASDISYTFVPKVVIVCGMLHNILQKKNIPVPQDSLLPDDNALIQPNLRNIHMINYITSQNQKANRIRQALLTVTNLQPRRK